MRIKREDGILFIIVVFMASNISAMFEYYFENIFGGYFRYLISILVILFFGIELLLYSHRKVAKSRSYYYIQFQILFVVLYGFLYFVNHQLLSDNSNQPFNISSYTVLALQNIAVLLIGNYIVLRASESVLKRTVAAYFILVIIDCLFSLYYLSINDQALRISSWVTGESFLASTGLHGVCNALHIYSFVALLPVLLFLIKERQRKIFPIILFALTLITVLRAGYTMAMTIAVVYCLIVLVYSITTNKVIRLLSTVGILLVFLLINWSAIFLFLAKHLSNASVSQRFYDLYQLMSLGQSGDALTSRINVYSRGLEGFQKSPIWGNVLSGNRIISMHSTIIDILSDWGLIGFLLYFGFLYSLRRTVMTFASADTTRWARHTFILYYITITINTLGRYANGTMVVAVVLPAILIIHRLHLDEEKSASIS